jgi:dTDP-4-dehydrorhamnose 3,5-epimerase
LYADERGAFFESFNASQFAQDTGLQAQFVQDNHSTSHQGVLRGLHYQVSPHAQGKLVRVTRGAAFDVAVDLRPTSTTFGEWAGVHLSAENRLQLWIPEGFAHGFLALEDDTHFAYKTTDFWDRASERAIRWNDRDIAIAWPLEHREPIISRKDAEAASFADFDFTRLPSPPPDPF